MTVLDKIKDKKVYLSAPITGIKNDNKAYFDLMESIIKEVGARVILNPLVLPKGLTHSEYMTIDLAMVEVSDTLIMGDGWADSTGCNQEYVHACDNNVDTVRFDCVMKAIENKEAKCALKI